MGLGNCIKVAIRMHCKFYNRPDNKLPSATSNAPAFSCIFPRLGTIIPDKNVIGVLLDVSGVLSRSSLYGDCFC